MAAPKKACDTRTNNTVAKLLECVDADGAVRHLEALQAIATDHEGRRAAGTDGYEASVDYVVQRLEAAGWQVSIDEFPFTFTDVPKVRQLAPIQADYEGGVMTGTGTGTVQGRIVPVDLNLVAPFDPVTSACEAADFTGLDFSGPNDIALIQRGTCEFGVKAKAAQDRGAEAVIIMNQGNTPARSVLLEGTLIGQNPSPLAIPVAGVSFADGVALAQPGSEASVSIAPPVSKPQKNIIAELPGVNDDNVVMAGAHLDSVLRGPGINDNGSGSAALLDVAERIAKVKPQNTLRFAWWGAEEAGLLGSRAYVAELATLPGELDRIALYLNFDMVASPNHVFMVYDGDESGFPAPDGVPIPDGSIAIENLFESYYTWIGQPYDDAQFSGRSDYQAFIQNGIPSGGLFTGAEGIKTAAEADIWGGVAGAQYDPCYHQRCDDIDNLNLDAFDVNVDAIALAVLAYAYDTSSVNGVAGVRVPGGLSLPAPAGPVETAAVGGGGLDHDHDHAAAS
ncbi:M28 family metallopeptidase [Agromyces sp. MMS24-K17]|uniref:M28 family metallopeptidase n=1 Tax=Agromyces sp. MMS24-K17 TaxID=3372850 RepID=UPI0037547E63